MEIERTPAERFAALPDYAFAPHWLEADGLRMHYVDEGSGAPVLLLHGEPTWSFLWRHVVPEVVAAGRRAIAPDLIGFGRSDKPAQQEWYSYDRHVDLVTRLVLESGTSRGLSPEIRAAYDAPFPTPASKAGALAFPELVPVQPGHPTAAALDRVREALAQWDKPAHVIWADEHAVLPTAVAERFVALIPGATRPKPIPGAGHFLQEDASEEVAEAICASLAG